MIRFVILLCSVLIAINGDCSLKLSVKNGDTVTVNGVSQISPNGIKFCSYLGIPYAKPPVDNLRFELPQITRLDKIPLNLKQKKSSCLQPVIYGTGIIDSEDCLYINIFTPTLKSSLSLRSMPVFVWIHGGTFNTGSAFSDEISPDFIVEQDIVMVSFNYRLGPLGFLYQDGEEIPGNLGLRDQQTALIWIQNNIQHFGGDPNVVTLVGWSAGAAAVHYHMYAQSSAGLFHRAIVMSGSFLNPWAFNQNTNKCIQELCNKMMLPCERGNLKNELKHFNVSQMFEMKMLPAIEISYFGTNYPCFVPTIEKHIGMPDDLLVPIAPQNMIKKFPIQSDIPLLMGFTTFETDEWMGHNFNTANFDYKFPNDNKNIIAILKDFILKSENGESKDSSFSLNKLLGVADLFYGIKIFAEMYANEADSKLFLYEFAYNGSSDANNSDGSGSLESIPKNVPAHGDDLKYLFAGTDNNLNDAPIRNRMIALWTNFVKFGNPTPALNKKNNVLQNIKWQPFKPGGQLLQIDNQTKMIKYENRIYYKLWEIIYNCLYEKLCDAFYREITK